MGQGEERIIHLLVKPQKNEMQLIHKIILKYWPPFA